MSSKLDKANNTNTTTIVTLFGRDIQLQNQEEFFAFIKRYSMISQTTVEYRQDGGVNINEASAIVLKKARKDLPSTQRMNDINKKLNHELELFVAENNSCQMKSWRGCENYAQSGFELN